MSTYLACVCARVRFGLFLCVYMHGCGRVFLCVGVCVCVVVCPCLSVCVRLGVPLLHRRYCIARPATRGQPRVCVCVCATGRSVAWAAGATWKSRTTGAQWAARFGHTTVIDAAGAIYVIGGNNGPHGIRNDVLKSADGGADRTRGVLRGLLGGTR